MSLYTFFRTKINRSIASKLVFTFVLLFMIFSTSITFIIYDIAKKQLLAQIDKSAELTLTSISNYMQGYLSEKAQVCKSLLHNKAVQDYDLQTLKKLLPTLLKDNPELSNAYVSRSDGKIVVFYHAQEKIVEWQPPAGYIPAQQDWYRLAAEAGNLVITPAYTDEVSGKTMVSLTAPYHDPDGKFQGVVGVDIRLNTLVKQVKSINIDGNGKALLVDTSGTILAFHDASVVMKKIAGQNIYPGLGRFFAAKIKTASGKSTYLEQDNKIFDIYWSDVPISHWILAVTIPHSAIMAPVFRITRYFTLLGLIGMLIFALVTAFVSKRISLPIIALSEHARRVAGGDLTANSEIKGNDEIGQLSQSINDMTVDLRKLIGQIHNNAESVKQKAELEKSLKEAELKALQLQINPHFMFNVLNSVNRLIGLEQYSTAQDVLDAFTKMLRYSMRDIGNIVPLTKELDYVEKYLYLQNLRFGNRVNYQITIHPELADFRLPFFTLQPLVENAIIHGLEPKESMGEIQILTEIDENSFQIIIRDNGLGMAMEKCRQIENMDLSTSDSAEGYHGIGISNIQHRLKIFFGTGYRFQVKSDINQGTTIILTFFRHQCPDLVGSHQIP